MNLFFNNKTSKRMKQYKITILLFHRNSSLAKLDKTLFRTHACHKIQRPSTTITHIADDNTSFSSSSISHYLIIRRSYHYKRKDYHVVICTKSCTHYYMVVHFIYIIPKTFLPLHQYSVISASHKHL